MLRVRKLRPIGQPVPSRRAMLETLVRNLDMVRLTVSAVALVTAVGCTGLIDNHSGEDSPELAAAKQAFVDQAQPVLSANCGGCHQSQQGADFLKGAGLDVRDTLLNYDPQIVNLTAPGSSRLLTKGPHSGPGLTGEQTSAILGWIKLEKDAQVDPSAGAPDIEIPQFAPVLCPAGTADEMCPTNDLDLAVVGLAGAKIHFTAEALPSGLYVKNLKVEAATDGAYIEHPLFVSWPAAGDPVPDGIDRFFDVKLDLMANGSDMIGGGTVAFLGFVPTDMLTIHFKAVKPYQAATGPGGTGPGGTTTATGCKQLAKFKTAAQAPLQTSCASCHAGGNGNATSAMNLTGIDKADDAMILNACNQVRTRINFQTTDQSGFYIAPDPNSGTSHQFKFGTPALFTSFKSAVDPWVQAEKTSP